MDVGITAIPNAMAPQLVLDYKGKNANLFL